MSCFPSLLHLPSLSPMDKPNFFYSESDDQDHVSALTRRFSRSASLQHPLYNLKVFSASPESTLAHGWQVSQPPPLAKAHEDAWNLIYAAAGQVARMKMSMSNKNRGLLGPFAPPHSSPWGRSDGDGFFRQPQYRGNRDVSGTESGGGGCGGRLPQSAWSPPPQHRPGQHNGPGVVVGGGCDGGKRECAGTGVFLPRRYCHNPPESRKRQARSPANLPARMIQSSDKTLGPITTRAQIQERFNGGFVSHYEMLMGGRGMESAVNNPEVLLPQEWTY